MFVFIFSDFLDFVKIKRTHPDVKANAIEEVILFEEVYFSLNELNSTLWTFQANKKHETIQLLELPHLT